MSIVRTQEKDEEYRQGKVEVHQIPLAAKFPTEIQTTPFLVHQIFGNESKAMIFSPTGGLAKSNYYKPLSQLTRDAPTGSGTYLGKRDGAYKYKSVEEDTENFWLLQSPDFRKLLIKEGWMIFPEINPLTDNEKKELGFKNFNHMFRRDLSLADLSRIIQLTDVDKKYSETSADLAELMPFIDKASFIYEGGTVFGGRLFTRAETKYNGKTFDLRVRGLEALGNDSNLLQKEPNTAQRNVHIEIPFSGGRFSSLPGWWTGEATERVVQVAKEYADKVGTIYSIGVSDDKEKLEVELSNRHEMNSDLSPDTRKLLEQAVLVENFVLGLVAEEHKDSKATQEAIFARRRALLEVK